MKSLTSHVYKFFTAFIIVMLALSAMPVSPVYAATAGPNFAGAGAEVGGPGNVAWNNEGFITADDTNYATTNLGNSAGSEYLQGTNFGFAIPSNATINGIQVTIMRQSSSNQNNDSIQDTDLYLVKAGAGAGTDHASPNDWPTSMGAAAYGATNDLWGTTWTPAEINAANFGVRLSVENESNFNRTGSVDYIQVTITYTLPSTIIGDGNSPANKSVNGSETNQAVSTFTLSTSSGTDTVTDLVITGTNTANIAASGVKIYRDNGGTVNEWDATDTLVGTASFAGATATFTGISLAVNTTSTQYIITYDIVAAPTNSQTLTAFVSNATTNTLPVANNDNTDATITVDTAAPTVTDVDAPTNGPGTYNIGDTITVRVIFSETLTITGTPQLTLETGTVDRVLSYSGMSGTTGLLFTYIVQPGDASADLDYVSTNSLTLNGGTIRDGVGNNATLTLPAPLTPGSGSLGDNEGLVIDGIVPTVMINQASGQADPANSQPINFTVTFSEPINDFNDAADFALSGTAGVNTSGTFTGVGINITNLGSNIYNVAISGLTVPGTITVAINANAVTDNAGNGNTASTNTDNTVTLNGYTIIASVGAGTNGGTGTINPNGSIGIIAGASRAFESVPATSSIVSNILVDGFSVGSFNNYTLNNVTSNRTITAIFDGGWAAPTANTTPGGWTGCSNGDRAYTSNNSFTTCDNGESVVYRNFGLNIPAGSTINYVEIAIEGHTDGRNLNVSISENGGANFGTIVATNFSPEPASPDKTMKVGNRPGDDWGVPFSPASFSDTNFRVQVTGTGGGSTFSLDQLQVKVNYTLPPVTINQAVGQPDPTNTSPINFTVVFPYTVTNFATGDLTLTGTAGATTAIVTGSGTTYNVAVSGMTTNGTVIASIAAGVATDANGTPNTPSTSTDNVVTYDSSVPTATIDLRDASDSGISYTDNITNAVSPVFEVAFSEDLLSAPTSSDFSNVGTATGCSFAVGVLSGNVYPVTVSGCSEGTLILRLAASAVTDMAGTPNAQTDGPTVTIDRTSPTVTINQAAGQPDPTGASPINFTAVFTEATFGFTGVDVSISGTANPTVANVTGGPTTFNVAVSNMTTSGPGLTVIASIGAGVATDEAGNPNIASTSTDNSVVYNSNAPIASINLQSASDSGISNADNVTNVASPVLDVSFDEAVNGLDNTDFSNVGTAAGCTFAVGTPTGNNYPVTVSGCSNGTLIAQLAAGAVQNGTLIPNAQTTGPTVTIDRTAPTVLINQAAGQPNPTNILPISFTATFSETVYNFTSGDVTLAAPAGATATLIGTGPTYGVDVSGLTANGTVIVSIGASVATDAAGNNNVASTSTDNQVTYDTIAPTVTINQLPLPPVVPNQPDPTNASPINFIVVFSEPVTGFSTGDVTLSGGTGATTATVTLVNSTTYNVAVSGMTNSGNVIADIAASVATDLAGNDNAASTSTDNQVTYDITRPTVTVEQAVGQPDPTNLSPIHFTVEFSKPVTGFDATDVILSSGTATVTEIAPNNGTTYDISVTGMVQGFLSATIPAGRAVDAVGNTNTASTSADNIVLYDIVAPTVTINQAVGQADPTNTSPIHFTATFSEAISGFDGTDVTLSSGTATVTPVSATVYDISVTGMAQGVLTATIPAGRATDQVGILNVASTSTDNSVLYDTVTPGVTVNQEATQPDPTNTGPINFTVVFSEPVSGFTNADLVGNFGGTAAPTTAIITTGSGATYNVAISGMAADGTVTLNLPAGIAQDGTGNSSTASTSTDNTVTYDTTRPTVTINQAVAQIDPTSLSPINFTVVFSEPVTGFTSADINLTGTAGSTTAVITTVNSTTYNVEVSGMTTSGTVTPFVYVNATQDAAGNSSFASTSLDNTVTYDNAALTVTINQDAGQSDPTGTAPINFAVIFNKPINSSTFTGVDVNLAGGTAPGTLTAVVTGSGSTFNVAVSGMTGTGTVIATIPAGGIQDTAGNSNTVSTSVDNMVTYDATTPSVTVNQGSLQSDPTNGMPINFAVVFSEAVADFTSADVLTTGSTAPGTLTAAVTGGGTTYNVAISGMTNSGTVIVTVPAGVATDVSGNGNTASTSTDNIVNYDVTRPTVTINQAVGQADPTGVSPIIFDVIFSESVSGFTGADVTLTGAAGANTAVVSGGGAVYSVAVSGMTGSGPITATVNLGAATDQANNTSLASTSTDNTVTYDNATLSVTINQAGGQADPTNAGPINFAVIFSKPVTDFTTADVNLLTGTAPGTLTATVTGSGTTYNVAVNGMIGSGTVIATIPAGGVHDSAGNGNANSTSTDNTVTYDVTAPTVTINQAAGQADPTGVSPINFTVVFSEPMTGFTNADITLGGTATGPLTVVVSGSGATYTVTVSGMTTSGTVTASIAAGVATDVAGNNNTASTTTDNSVTFDNAALTVTINQAGGQADPTNGSPINFTVVFSKPVTGFATGDIVPSGTAGATNAAITGSGATYNVAVSGMAGNGTVTVAVPAGVALDTVGNANPASTSTDNTVLYDNTLPTVTINQAIGQVDPTNASPINFTVMFSESVTNFTAADVVLSGTAPGTLTATVIGSGAFYSVTVSGMTGSGTVVATIPAGNAQDSAGNSNANSTSTDNTVTYDVTPPTVTINQAASPQTDPTGSSPVEFTVVFSEPVFGFTDTDVTFGGSANPTTATVSGSGTTYTVSVSGMPNSGTVTASIAANVATDAAGNANSASTSSDNIVNFDNAALSVTVNQAAAQADPTNASTINFTVVFNKPVTGFITGDIVPSGTAGATNAIITGSGLTYNVAVSGMIGNGTVSVTVPAGVAQDSVGNGNAASTSTDNTVTYDNTLPTVTINQTVGQPDPTNTGPINFTVVFSEPVTGFADTDIALSGTANATTAVVTGSGATYSVAVSGMTASGTVIATVPAGNAQDSAGNTNTNSTSTDNTVLFDFTPPTVTINQAVGQADPTGISSIDFTVTFSEPVTVFTNTDVTIGGTATGPITSVVNGSGANYTVTVSGMTGSGTVIASIPAGSASDASNNANLASTSTDNTVTFDNNVPSVTINQAAGQADPTNGTPITFTIIFGKPVTGFTNTDVLLSGTAGATNAAVSGSGANYTVAVSGMSNSGTVTVTIPAGAAQDTVGNSNTASTSTDNTVTFDNTAPTVTINRAGGQADPTNVGPINFTVVFNEPVTGFTGADVALTGSAGATTAVVTGSGTTYNVAVSGMTSAGAVIATIPAGNAQDAAGNGNAVSTSSDNNVDYDPNVPTVTIDQAVTQVDPTNASPITFDVVFSKAVTGFTGADVTLTGTAGATTAVVTGSGTTYTVQVSGMTGDGTVIASIPAGVATDSIGNPNAVSTSTDNTVTYDITGPTVTINKADTQQDPTGVSPINFTVIFSEPVAGFAIADLNLGGTAGATTMVISGSGATYNVAVSGMVNTGTVFVTITDAAGTDAAGNPSAASTSTYNSVRYDTGAPSVTINQATSQTDPTSTSPISFTVIFSKPVTGFISADVNVTGTAGATTVVVSGSGTTYTVTVSGMADSGTVIANIPADRAQDSAGNGNIASTSTDNSVTYDISEPTVTINQAGGQGDPTNTSPVNFAVVFSEPVTGFTSADVILGGTAGATTAVVTGSGATYNVAASGMVTDGTITATIGAAVVLDASGNGNVASTSSDNEITYSTTNPTVTIDQSLAQIDPTNVSPINFTVVFSKLVTDFTDSDITIGGTAGATTATVTGSGLTYNVAVTGMPHDGTVTVSIPGGAATDASGNPNIPSSSADNSVTYFDGIGPSVSVVNTSADTGDGSLNDSEIVTVNVNQFIIKFGQDVYNPAGDGGTDDVTNPNNYILVRELGDAAGFQTVSCSAGIATPADTRITIGAIAYDAETFTATFSINNSLVLSNGKYRLFVCGTTSIVDPLDNNLALVGSSGANTDFIRTFDVIIPVNGGNGGNSGTGNSSDSSGNGGNRNSGGGNNVSTATGALIPVTGFAPGVVTSLPEQPAELAYDDMSEMRLEIPSLSLNIPIVGIAATDTGWDLTWLGNNAGYLEGSAYPTWAGNTVLTGHVLDETNAPGAFAYIKELKNNDLIFLHAFGSTYVYQVEKNMLVKPHKINSVFKHEEYNWLTLVTCESFSTNTNAYQTRRVVRAVLISVVTDP